MVPPVASGDELPLNSPGVLGTLGCLVRRSDLGVDLLLVVAVVVNREGDPAEIERKDLGSGGDGYWTALVNLAQDLSLLDLAVLHGKVDDNVVEKVRSGDRAIALTACLPHLRFYVPVAAKETT